MPTLTKGLKFSLLAATISGFSIFINKFAVASMGNPLILPTVKNSLVGILFISILIATQKWRKINQLTRKQFGQLLAIGIIGGSLPFYLFFTGLSQIPAINSSIIHKSLIIWVALLAIPLLKEKMTKTQGLAVLILFASNFVIGGFKGLTYSTGEMLVVGATILWAIETILVKKVLANVDPAIAAASRMSLGSLGLILILLITEPGGLSKISALNQTQWFWISLTAITLSGYVLSWYYALKFSSAISVSSVLVLATVITNVLSAVFITHSLSPVLSVQNLMLLAGTLIFILGRKKENTAAQQTL